MNKLLFSLALVALAITQGSAMAPPPVKNLITEEKTSPGRQDGSVRVAMDPVNSNTVESNPYLACPEGTTLSGSWYIDPNKEFNYTAGSYSDAEMSNIAGLVLKQYRYFSENRYAIDSLRVIGYFGYTDLIEYITSPCDSRGGMDDKGNMTRPINFEVAFYKINEKGLPGEVVYRDTVALKGVRSGVAGTQGNLYFFTPKLKKPLKMYEGFFSFCAVNNGGPFTDCWFGLAGCESTGGYQVQENLVTKTFGEPYTRAPLAYCFFGSEDEPLAQKAIKLEGLPAPVLTEGSDKAKVQVSVNNLGSQPVNDVTLELYGDDRLVATEKINRTLAPDESYTYTFGARVDCSYGEHRITVRNVTPGDENLSGKELSVMATGDISSASQNNDPFYISHIKVGNDIDNASDAQPYTSFEDQVANLTAGQTITATMTTGGAEYRRYMKLWVDWNGNNSFDDKGDFVGYSTTGTFNISVPQDVEVLPGEKKMRFMVSAKDTPPTGTYEVGETEDYTLNIVRPEGAPAFSTDKWELYANPAGTDPQVQQVVFTNKGLQALNGEVSIDYDLPHSPIPRFADGHAKPLMAPAAGALVPVLTKAAKATVADESEDYMPRYDRANNGWMRLSGASQLTFANLYPGEMMTGIKGMQLTGVDVFAGDIANATLVVYGQKTQTENGDLLASQKVTLTPNTWNTLTLDKPVTVDGTDLWVGLQMATSTGKNQIGVDYSTTVPGFADLVKSDKWYTMASLGAPVSINLDARFSGQRTPAVGWLKTDKTTFTIPADGSTLLTVTANTQGLEPGVVYEGVVKIKTNDPVTSLAKIPVYLTAANTQGIKGVEDITQGTIRVVAPKTIVVDSKKKVVRMAVFRPNGSQVQQSWNSRLSLSACPEGVYIVKVTYEDQSSDTASVVVK